MKCPLQVRVKERRSQTMTQRHVEQELSFETIQRRAVLSLRHDFETDDQSDDCAFCGFPLNNDLHAFISRPVRTNPSYTIRQSMRLSRRG